jgi:hypothetical protein
MMTIIKDWVWLFTAISPFLLAFGMLYLRSQFPTKAEAEKTGAGLKTSIDQLTAQVEERHGQTDRRLTHLESVTEHLPSRADIAAIERRMGDVEKQGAVTAETVRGMDRILGKVDRTLEMVLQNQIQESRS